MIASRLACASALAFAFLVIARSACAGPLANADDYSHETRQIAEIVAPESPAALAAIEAGRANSPFVSSLPASDLNRRLMKVLQWIVRDYAHSGELRLLSAAPEGLNGAGLTNMRLRTLQKTFWLQDNSLYGARALIEFVPPLGRILNDSWRAKWEEKFPSLCPDTESSVVGGEKPAYDGGRGNDEARCKLPRPGVWEMLRMQQYPSPGEPGFDMLQTPIVGTDYPGNRDGGGAQVAPIGQKSPRDLLKYGCLRQVILGNVSAAQEMFDLALALWDGEGFIEPKGNDTDDGAKIYWTRDLAFAALCANALGQGGQQTWGNKTKVSKAPIEQKIWLTQSASGGIWSNYCSGAGTRKCNLQAIPRMAKQTNEIAPLILLAYGRNIWAKSESETRH
jgi:hypothetical protein